MSASVLLESGQIPTPAPELVKHRPELSLVGALLVEPGVGESSLVLRGDPGSGKSTLLEAAAHRARDHGLRVLRACGVQAEAELNFSALHQLLHPLREHLEALPDKQRETLERVFGLTDGPAPTRFAISTAALALIDVAATDGPVLLLIDDVAWIDRCSAEVLGFVARRLTEQPVVFLAAVSDADPVILTAGLPELRLGPLPTAEPDRVPALTAVAGPGGGTTWRGRERRRGWHRVPETDRGPLPSDPDPSADLTAQELRIAGLAAQGLTNKQIGERLFLSHRTVGTHLYKLFPKLGISSRAALRDALEAHTRRTAH